jgi:hypothetical protein
VHVVFRKGHATTTVHRLRGPQAVIAIKLEEKNRNPRELTSGRVSL